MSFQREPAAALVLKQRETGWRQNSNLLPTKQGRYRKIDGLPRGSTLTPSAWLMDMPQDGGGVEFISISDLLGKERG